MFTFSVNMFTSAAFDFFGGQQAVADKLGISRQAVGQWTELVPPVSAMKLWKLSGEKLQLDPDAYDSWNNRKQKTA